VNTTAPDTSAPAVAITSPSNNQTVTSSPITIAGTASDLGLGNSGISSVTVNGVVASGGTATGSGIANWSRLVALNAGANTITVVAKDASSNPNSSMVSITVNYTAPAPSPGAPILAYSFNEASGSIANDSSGAGNDGILVNAPTRTAGVSGSALNFDGIDDYVNAGDIAALNGLAAVTVSAWVKGSVGTLSPDSVIVAKDSAFALVVGLTSAHKAQFLVKSGGSWYGFPSSVTSVDDGTFHYLTGVYDGTTVRIYVDGILEGSQDVGSLTLNTSLTNLEIASCAGGPECHPSGEMWGGVIDEVRIYDRALSQAEIQANMITPVGAG